MDYLVELKGIKKSFGGVKALNGVDLQIRPGEVHCLAGENGSGKSTIIKVVSGYYHPDQGEIKINGKSYEKMTPQESIQAGIQVIYQDFSLFGNLTVRENLALNQMLAKKKHFIDKGEIDRIAKRAVERIRFNVDLDALVETLPVADKQLVAIARALLDDARLIIMDEPTTALTRKETKRLFEIVNDLKRRDVSILFVSHKLEEVFEICEQITVLCNGQNVISCPISEMDDEKFSYYMTGRIFGALEKRKRELNPEVVMELKNITAPGIEDISFKLHKGEILGITGQLGSGRTELSLTLFGLNPAQSGAIFINGRESQIKSVGDALRNGIGLVPEDRLTEGLFLPQSILKNVVIGKLGRLLTRMGLVDDCILEEESLKWIKEIGIATANHHLPVNTLSGGNQQKVVLSKWLAMNPDILILNGPTVGVDIGAKYDIHSLLRKCTGRGMSVIVISDDVREILDTADRALVMTGGRLVKEFSGGNMSALELSAEGREG